MKRKWFRAVSIFATSVFIWTNCIYASGAAIYYSEIAKDKLAVQSKLEDVFLGAQLMYTGDTALEKALVNNIGGIDDLYRNIARLREDFMKVEGIPGEWKNRVMWLVFNDRSDFKKKAYYIFTPAGIYFRYTNYPDVKDEFYSVLQKYAEKYGDTEQVKVNGSGFFREKYKLAGINLDFINKVLREIYGIEEEIKTKGEHVGPSYLADKLEDCNIKPINGTEYEGLIQDAILRMKGIYPDLGSALGYLLNKNKIKIVETKNGEDMYFIYLNLFRKMRYNLIASLDDTIYIPKGLIKLFLNPERLKEELECYLGKDLYNKLAGGRSGDELKNWLKRCIIGGLVHEVYEVQEYIKDKDRYDRKKVHPSANEKERIIAGISPFDGESAFDDVTKFLILKELKLKPDIMIFDILRDRLRDNEDIQNYGLGFERCGLRNIENKLVKDKLEKLFGEPTEKDDAYHLVIFRGRVIAFSKVRSDGTEIVYNIYNDEATLKESGYPISTIVRDYEYIVKRSKKPISERLALTYEELREYHKEWLKRKEGFEEMPDGEERGKLMEELKRDGIFFAGGKGFSLSLMDDVVDVPPGLTISTTAYFSFISSTPELRKLIDEKLRTLDTMDDRARQVAAKEIRDVIINTPIPEEIKEEIRLMHKYLDAKAVAIRSSGPKEDMEISTWLPISTGSQAGQADTYLNVRGEEDVIEKATVGPIKIIKKAVKDSGIRLLNLSSREDYKAQRMESHLLPLYLYMKVKEELDYNDAQMMAISYTDREGVIKIDENAASVMGTILSRELKRNISKDKAIEVLQAHEEIEKAIMDLGIDFTGLRQGLIEYLDIVRDDWDENFKNVVGEGNGQDRLVRLLEAFLRNYPAYRLRLDELSEVTSQIVIIKEILVNQIIERMFFRQGVKVLPAGYKDARLERIELPKGFQEILGNYLINWSKLRDRNCHYVKLSEIVSGIDPNNEELVKRLTKEVLGERLRYVNKDVNYAIAITKGDLEKRDTLIWQLQVVRDKIRDIVRITQNPVTITLELDDIDHVRDAISLLRSLGFEADNNLRFGLTIKGKGANRELINEANPIGITTLVPYEDGITEIAESSFILLLLDILYSEDLRGMDILIPYESLRAHARETQRIRGIEFIKRLFPGKEVYIKEGWVALKKLLPNQTHVARFKIDAEKVRLERGIYEPIIVIDMIDSDNFLIVDGHHRAKAAAELDRRYCPACIVTAEPPFMSKDFKNIIDTNIRSGLSHLGNLGVVDVKARILDEIKKTNIWEAWFTAGGELINETVLNEGIFNSEIKDRLGILKKKIMEVADRIGFGILCGVDRIRLVDNIMPKGMEKEGDLVPYSMIKEENGERILLLDKDALKDEDVLYLVLLHEFREALLTIVEPKDKALRELTGIYLSAKDALKEGIKDVGDLSNLDPDSQFLKVIEQLEGKRDEEIIAVIIEFMRSISYYREFFEGPVRFDFSGDWQREMLIEIEKGIDRYQAALNVFNRIAEAKGIVTKVKVSEEKMVEEQKKKGPIERKGLKDIYKAFSELLDWYSKNTSEVFFIDTKWQGIAVRRLNGEVMSNIDLNDKYQPLWRLFKSKGINSVAISNEVFSKVKDSANRFINLIDDILFSASETDFIGYAHINDITVKVTPDDGGKRVVITNRLDRKAEDILDWLLTEGITKASELTNTFENVKRFLGLSPEEQGKFLAFLRDKNAIDPDGEYLALLKRLSEIKNVTEDEIIASVVKYVFRTKLYEKVRVQLGLPEGLADKIRDLEPRLDDVLQIFNEIAKAKEGKELIEEVKEGLALTIKVVKTFTGLRIQGLDKLGKRLARMITAVAKQVSNVDRISGLVKETRDKKYILADIKKLKDSIGEVEYRKIEKNLADNNCQIITELPSRVDLRSVIRLVDPVDLEKTPRLDMLYLTMPYTRSSLYMAAIVLDAGGDVKRIDNLVKGLINDLYREILDREVTDSDLKDLFRQPWKFLPEIEKVIDDLSDLHKAISVIEKAA